MEKFLKEVDGLSVVFKTKKTSHKVVKKLHFEHFLEKKLEISSTLIQKFTRFVWELSQFDFNGKFRDIELQILKRSLNSFEFVNSSYYKLKNYYVSKYPSVLHDVQEYNGIIFNKKSEIKKPLTFYK